MGKQTDLLRKFRWGKYGFSIEISTVIHVLTVAPDGWSDEYVYTRSKKFKGIQRRYTEQTLRFVKGGRTLLKDLRETLGINENPILRITCRDFGNNWEPVLVFVGIVNMQTLVITDIYAEAQVEDDSARFLLYARRSLEIDLTRTTTLEGVSIPALSQTLFIPEIDFFATAAWHVNLTTLLQPPGIYVVPFLLLGSTIDTAQTPVTGVGLARSCVINDSGGTIDLTVSGVVKVTNSDYDQLVLKWIVRDSGGSIKSSLTLGTFPGNFVHYISSIPAPNNQLLVDEGCGLEADITSTDPGIAVNFFDSDLDISVAVGAIPEATINVIHIKTAFSRLIKIISGLDFESVKFADIDEGDMADGILGVFTTGLNVRGADGAITVTLDKLFDAMNAMYNCALIIEGDTVRLEGEGYVFVDIVGYDLTDRVLESDIELEFSDDFFSGVVAGYAKFSDETRNGLREFNTKYEYSSVTPVNQKRDLTSPYRADTSGILNLLDQLLSEDVEADVQGDSDLFYIAAYRNVGVVTAKTDQGYDIAPTTWFNLDVSPARLLRRHRLRAFLDDVNVLRLEKTEKVSTLATQETGEGLIDEQADIPVTELPDRLFKPDILVVETYLTANEVNNLNYNEKIKLTEDYSGWVEELQYNFKENQLVQLRLKRSET